MMGAGKGDRFIVRELLSGKDQTDYGEIVCFRVRDLGVTRLPLCNFPMFSAYQWQVWI